MEFKCFSQWNQLPDSAERLFYSASKDSMFFTEAWLQTMSSSALDDKQSLLLACVIEGGSVVAILPLKNGVNNDWYALGHLYTWLYTLLVDKEAAHNRVIKCLAMGISRSSCQLLRLEPVAENDNHIQRLQLELEALGFYCNRQYKFYNWFHPVSENTIADYMAGRPSRVQNTIARKQRKLAREHSYRFVIYNTDDLAKGLADYNIVYSASWKAKELFDDIIERLVHAFAEKGWLRLGVLYIDEKPAAAQLWFVVHPRANIFKLAYDEKWKQYSPGSILIRHMMEYVIEIDKVQELDFLMGNDNYKQDWMTERRERWGLYCAKQKKPDIQDNGIFGFLKGLFRPLN